ncbi:MAG: FAD-binding protein [Acidimicrobiales bacterium]
MKIVVCIKQVPQLDRVAFTSGLNRICREGVESLTNPLDLEALECAIQLRASHGGEVVAVTMGPPGARSALDQALAAGSDRAVHLVDGAFAGADTLATARTLAAALEQEHPDLVLTGRSTLDGGTAQVPPQLAELLGWPQVTEAVQLSLRDHGLEVVRATEGGPEAWTVMLPAVVSVVAGPGSAGGGERPAGPPRRSGSAAITERNAADLGDGSGAGYGIRGSATYVKEVVPLGPRPGRATDDPAEVASLLMSWLAGPGGPERTPGPPTHELWVVAGPGGPDGGGRQRWSEGTAAQVEGLAAARAVAGRLSAEVTAVMLGGGGRWVPPELERWGADKVLVARSDALVRYSTSAFTAALAHLVEERSPLAVIGPWTSTGRDLLPRVAARLSAGMTGDVIGLDVEERGLGDRTVLDVVWLKPAWAGSALARVVARTVPSFGTLRRGALAPLDRAPTSGTQVEEVDLDRLGISVDAGAALARRAASLDVHREGGLGPVAVESARAVVCVGEGLEPAAVGRAAALAQALGGALAGSQLAVAAGLVPAALEIDTVHHALSPGVFIGLGLRRAHELAPARTAGGIVLIGGKGSAGGDDQTDADLVRAADLIVPADPATFLTSLLAALAGS